MENGRGLEGELAGVDAVLTEFTGAIRPGQFERRDVPAMDLLQRRIPPTTRITTVRRPTVPVPIGSFRDPNETGDHQSKQQATQGLAAAGAGAA
jgi:hypothetical protein